MENFLNQLLCGFRKAHSTQHVLFRLIQSWQKVLDQSEFVGTILMDLYKAYDCLPHDLMVAKLEGYGLAKESLQLINDYLSYRKQRTKIDCAYIVIGSILFAEFHRTLFWDLYFSIFLLRTFFLSLGSHTFEFRRCFLMVATFP